jgi:hypothetical protein
MSEIEPPDFRGLWQAIWDYEATALHNDVLIPWLADEAEAARRWLTEFAERKGDPTPPASGLDLETLYALSRVNETLLVTFQPRGAEEIDLFVPGFAVSAEEYATFVTALGLKILGAADFSPFFHEVVTVRETADPNSPTTIERELWPALMLGDMIFSRAGVEVSAGRLHARREIAENSTLYWAWRRRNRPSNDLSRGWGSNSQWGTDFRRDYRLNDAFHFNIDGKYDLDAPTMAPDDGGLTGAERIELLVNRCFLTVEKPHRDLVPFHDTYRMTVG